MLEKVRATIDLREALAVIGVGLFVFGVWEIYPPAAFMVAGVVMACPMVYSIARAK